MTIDILSILQLAAGLAPTVKSILDAATGNESIVAKIKDISAPLAGILETVGETLFPKAAPALRIAAGAMAAFDPDVTKWLQGSLNALLDPSPGLVVDGLYGPKTRAAVEQLQTKFGLRVDGWAGSLTQAAIASALATKPKL